MENWCFFGNFLFCFVLCGYCNFNLYINNCEFLYFLYVGLLEMGIVNF